MPRTKRRRRKLAILLLVFALAAAGVVGSSWLGKARLATRLEALRAEGMALFEAGSYSEAVQPLGQYVARVKDDHEAILAYARSTLETPTPNRRNLQQAVNAAKLAVELEPDNPEGHIVLMESYARGGLLTELVVAAEAVLRLDPDHRPAHSGAVQALVALERFDEAQEAADRYRERFPEVLEPYTAEVLVMTAMGVSQAEVFAYWRSDAVPESLKDEPRYLIELANRSFELSRAPDISAAERDELRDLAIESITTVVSGPAVGLVESISAITTARQLADVLDAPGLLTLADEASDRWSQSGSFRGEVLARESIAAWWRIDFERSLELASRLDLVAAGASPTAIGWRATLSAFSPERLSCDGCVEMLESDPSPEANLWLAIAEVSRDFDSGSPNDLLDRLDAVRSGDIGDIADILRGQVRLRLGQLETAAGDFQDAGATSRPGRQQATAALLGVYLRQGRPDEVLRVLGAVGQSRSALFRLPVEVESEFLTDAVALTLASPEAVRTSNLAQLVLRQLEDRGAQRSQDANLRALHAAALLANARTADGLEAARELADRQSEITDPTAKLLIEAVAYHDPSLASSLLAQRAVNGTPDLQSTYAAALLDARSGDPEAGAKRLEAFAESGSASTLEVELARAQFADYVDDPDALTLLEELALNYSTSSTAQLAVLRSEVAWEDEELIRRATSRLRALSGDDSIEWRLYLARAELEFIESVDEADRERVLAETLISVLRPILLDTPDHVEAARLTALIAMRTGGTSLARTTLERAIGGQEGAALYPLLYDVLMADGLIADARELLWQFALIDNIPDNLRRTRVGMMQRAGLHPQAVDDLGLLASKGRREDVVSYGMALASADRQAEAIAVAETLLDGRDVGASATVDAAEVLLAAGDVERAVGLLRAADDGSASYAEDVVRRTLRLSEDSDAKAWAFELFVRSQSEQQQLLALHAMIQAGVSVDRMRELRNTGVRVDGRAGRCLDTLAATDSELIERIAATALAVTAVQPSRLGTAVAELCDSVLRGEINAPEFADELDRISEAFPRQLSVWRLRYAVLDAIRSEAAEAGKTPASIVDALTAAARAVPGSAWPHTQLAREYLAAGDLDLAREASSRARSLTLVDELANATLAARIESRLGNLALCRILLEPFESELFASQASPSEAASIYAVALAQDGEARRVGDLVGSLAGNDARWAEVLYIASNQLPAESIEQRRELLIVADEAAATPSAAGAIAWFGLASTTQESADLLRAQRLLDAAIPLHTEQMGPELVLRAAKTSFLLNEGPRGAELYRRYLEARPESPEALAEYAVLMASGGRSRMRQRVSPSRRLAPFLPTPNQRSVICSTQIPLSRVPTRGARRLCAPCECPTCPRNAPLPRR
jgi:hypothetical protein